MASITATVSTENGDVEPAPRAAVIDTDARRARRLGVLLGYGGIGTGVEASNADVLVLSCDPLGREERETMETLRGEAPDTPLVVVVHRPAPLPTAHPEHVVYRDFVSERLTPSEAWTLARYGPQLAFRVV